MSVIIVVADFTNGGDGCMADVAEFVADAAVYRLQAMPNYFILVCAVFM